MLHCEQIALFSERGCATEKGFRLHGNSIDSGYGHADDAKVLLFLGTDGFKTSNLYPKLGTVTFEFEVQCEGPCHLSFYQVRFDDRQSKERTRDPSSSANRDLEMYRGNTTTTINGKINLKAFRFLSII